MIEWLLEFFIELAIVIFITDRIVMWRYDKRKRINEKQ